MEGGAVLVRPGPTSAAVVRHEIALDLAALRLSHESIEDVVLVVSELVTNAVLHAQGGRCDGLDVAWDVVGDDVVVRVNDTSDAPPLPRDSDERATGGRGLAIVAAIAQEWGVHPLRQGKQVWARVRVSRAV